MCLAAVISGNIFNLIYGLSFLNFIFPLSFPFLRHLCFSQLLTSTLLLFPSALTGGCTTGKFSGSNPAVTQVTERFIPAPVTARKLSRSHPPRNSLIPGLILPHFPLPMITAELSDQTGSVYDHHSTSSPSGDTHRSCPDGVRCYRTAYWSTFLASVFALGVSLWGIRTERARKFLLLRKRQEEEEEEGSKSLDTQHGDDDSQEAAEASFER